MKGGNNNMNKKAVATAMAVVVLGSGVLMAVPANAATTDTAKGNFFSTLVEKIATKFGLKQADVQAVFDEAKQQRQADMEKKFEDNLTQAVTDGKITNAQKQLIIAKHKELQANREQERAAMQIKTPEERKAAMQQHKQELDAWAQQNGIDMSYLMPHGGRGGPHGPMGNEDGEQPQQ